VSRRPLWNRGFLSLFATQFFEAASDNVIKGAITFAVAENGPWQSRIGAGGQGWITVLFTLPFVLLSAFGGRLADRYPKNRSTVVLKLASIGVALITVLAFGCDSLMLAITALVAFACVSSFFGPIKYGMIAELVEREQLGRANALINLGTNLAVITGMVIAGSVAYQFRVAHESGAASSGIGWWLPGLVMLGFTICGLLSCLTLPRLRAQSPNLPLNPDPFSTYFAVLKQMKQGPALAVALAWTFFYLLASVVLQILPDYASLLKVTEDETGYLMAIMAVAIGIGCMAAAWLSGARLRLGLVPFGAAGLAIAFLALGLAPLNYAFTAMGLFALGFVAGFYIIPLQASLQALAPDDERGRFLGTANAMSFAMGGAGGAIFSGARWLGVPSNRIFLIIAALTAIVCVVCVVWLRRNRAIVDAAATLRTLSNPRTTNPASPSHP